MAYERIKGRDLAAELSEKIIPALEKERDTLLAKRKSLGLAIDPFDAERRILRYPPPLSPEEAYLQARDLVGGELFKESRAYVRHLSKAERQTSQALAYHLERTDRYFKLGRIVPNNAITARKLREQHRRTLIVLSEAALRHEQRLEILRAPESRAQIRSVAMKLIEADREIQVERKLADTQFREVARAIATAAQLKEKAYISGEKEMIVIRRRPELIRTQIVEPTIAQTPARQSPSPAQALEPKRRIRM